MLFCDAVLWDARALVASVVASCAVVEAWGAGVLEPNACVDVLEPNVCVGDGYATRNAF